MGAPRGSHNLKSKKGNTMIMNTDNMIFEMLSTMKNNFSGTADQRFKQAKKLFLESIADTIDDNKEVIIKDFNREK